MAWQMFSFMPNSKKCQRCLRTFVNYVPGLYTNGEGLESKLDQIIANLTSAWSAVLFEAGIFDEPSATERIIYIKTKRE
jgi:hypothetical protein